MLALDPAAARTVARSLAASGNSLYTQAFAWRARLAELELAGHGLPARRAVEQAAEELWRNAAFLGLVSDRVIGADAVPIDAAALWQLAGGSAGRRGWLGPLRARLGASPLGGDRTGTFDAELRRPLQVYGADGVGRARSVLARLLADLSDPMQIREDEFALVRVADDRFVVVLPGVTDLSRPDLSLSEDHRSVRDLDQYAVASSRSSAVDDNRYASMVWAALDEHDVPEGAELLIVGHSFGADTALDLAADPVFNGGRWTVTHVVAAGYHSRPQLPDVVDGTEVLVLQNHRDAAVIVEGLGHSNASKSVTSRVNVVADAARFDLPGAFGHVVEAVEHDIATAVDLGEFAWDHGDDIARLVTGVGTGDVGLARGSAAELLTLEPGVERVGDHAVVDVFEGGSRGGGHHPANYIDHVADVDHPDVVAFLAGMSAQGYAADGSVVAVDVSVPRSGGS